MTDLYNLSDEELLALDPSTLTPSNTDTGNEQTEQTETETKVETEIEQSTTVTTEDTQAAEEVEVNDDVQDDTSANEPTTEDTDVNDSTTTNPHTANTDDTNQQADTTDTVNKDSNVDYKGFYDFVTKPFKANGKQIQVTNPDDMISLMQQGANYSKRMAELKPHLGIVKTLEQHGLLDTEKLAFLIDVHQQKPEALAKLIKDSEIDLYSFDAEQAGEYKPQTQIAQHNDLEETIQELSSTYGDSFNKVLATADTWDINSKQVIQNHPHLLRVMNAQVESGLFDKIVNAIDYEKMMGRLPNDVPFLDAYQRIESQFVNVDTQTATDVQNTTANTGFTAPRPSNNKPVNSNTTSNASDDKRRAGTPSHSNAPAQQEYNPLTISDEQLLEIMGQTQYH